MTAQNTNTTKDITVLRLEDVLLPDNKQWQELFDLDFRYISLWADWNDAAQTALEAGLRGDYAWDFIFNQTDYEKINLWG